MAENFLADRIDAINNLTRSPENPLGNIEEINAFVYGDLHIPQANPYAEPTMNLKGVQAIPHFMWQFPHLAASGRSWYAHGKQDEQMASIASLDSSFGTFFEKYPHLKARHFVPIYSGDVASDRAKNGDYQYALKTMLELMSSISQKVLDGTTQIHSPLMLPGDHDRDLFLQDLLLSQLSGNLHIEPRPSFFYQEVGKATILGVNTNLENVHWIRHLEELTYHPNHGSFFKTYLLWVHKYRAKQRQIINQCKDRPDLTVIGHQPDGVLKIARRLNAKRILAGHLHVPFDIRGGHLQIPHTNYEVKLPFLYNERGEPIDFHIMGASTVGRWGAEIPSLAMGYMLHISSREGTQVIPVPFGDNDLIKEVM